MTLSVTTEFHAEFEAERELWLRDRFMWYCGFMASIGLLLLLIAIISLDSFGEACPAVHSSQSSSSAAGKSSLFGGAMAYVSTRRRDMSRYASCIPSICIITIGIVALFVSPAITAAINAFTATDTGQGLRFGQGASGSCSSSSPTPPPHSLSPGRPQKPCDP